MQNIYIYIIPFTWVLSGRVCLQMSADQGKMEEKESEVSGKWMTEDTMKKSGNYSASSIRSIISFCRKFPESLTRTGCGIKYMHGDRASDIIHMSDYFTLSILFKSVFNLIIIANCMGQCIYI